MDKTLIDWWRGSAHSIVEQSLSYLDERIYSLKDYSNSLDDYVKDDMRLVCDFHKDVKKISNHIKKIKNEWLKHKENFFVINMKDYLFKLSLFAGTVSNLNEQMVEIVDTYSQLNANLREVQQRFADNDPTLDAEIIDEVTDYIVHIQRTDNKCKSLVEKHQATEEKRDELLEEMEKYISDKTSEFAKDEEKEM